MSNQDKLDRVMHISRVFHGRDVDSELTVIKALTELREIRECTDPKSTLWVRANDLAQLIVTYNQDPKPRAKKKTNGLA